MLLSGPCSTKGLPAGHVQARLLGRLSDWARLLAVLCSQARPLMELCNLQAYVWVRLQAVFPARVMPLIVLRLERATGWAPNCSSSGGVQAMLLGKMMSLVGFQV